MERDKKDQQSDQRQSLLQRIIDVDLPIKSTWHNSWIEDTRLNVEVDYSFSDHFSLPTFNVVPLLSIRIEMLNRSDFREWSLELIVFDFRWLHLKSTHGFEKPLSEMILSDTFVISVHVALRCSYNVSEPFVHEKRLKLVVVCREEFKWIFGGLNHSNNSPLIAFESFKLFLLRIEHL